MIFTPSNGVKNAIVVGKLFEGAINPALSGAAVIVGYLSNWDKSCHLSSIILIVIIVDLMVNARIVGFLLVFSGWGEKMCHKITSARRRLFLQATSIYVLRNHSFCCT